MKPNDNDLQGAVVDAVVRALVAYRVIEPEGKTRTQLVAEAAQHLRDNDVPPMLDYTMELLRSARMLAEQGELLSALVLHATWMEHTLNFIIHCAAVRAEIGTDALKKLFKTTPIMEKFQLVHLVAGEQMPEVAFSYAEELNDARNEHAVHYKWTPHEEVHTAKIQNALDHAHIVEDHLEGLTQRYVYRGFDFASAPP